MTASWTKGRSGEWLVRAAAGLAGQTISVAKKAGGASTVTLAKEIWSRDGVALYVIEQRARESSSRYGSYRSISARNQAREVSSGWTGCSCGSIEGNPRDSDCYSCRFDSE